MYLGGGIAPKLLAKLKDGNIHEGLHEQRALYMLDEVDIELCVVMNEQTALLGAASVAAALSHTLAP